MNRTKEILRSFILDTFPAASMGVVLEDTMSFLDGGIIESTGVLELVDFLEERFDITIEDSELVPENLDSINNLSRYLESKGVADVAK